MADSKPVIYDSKVFDGRMITEIRSNCEHSIRWRMIVAMDIENTDHFLQTDHFFHGPGHLPKSIVDFNELFIYHQVIVTSATKKLI